MSCRLILFSSVGLILICSFALATLPSFGFERLDAELQEIDINSGKARFTRFLFYVPVSQVEKDTVVSRLLAGSTPAPVEWRSVNLFTAGSRVSPHYRFHGALSQISRLELALQNSNLSKEDMLLYAKRIVKAWNDEGEFAARSIIDEVENQAFQN